MRKSLGNFTEIPWEHPKDPVSVEFVTKWASVVEEYSKRYGDKIKLWWVDGCYDFNGYDEEKLAILAKGVKEGVQKDGFLGILTGGLTASAGGIAAAITAGLLASILFKAKDKS